MSAEPQVIDTTDSPSSRSGPEGVVRHWMERLEDRVRTFPEQSILISFLLGWLLQMGVVRALLLNFLRLVLVLATPILFGFAMWGLYQSFAERVEH